MSNFTKEEIDALLQKEVEIQISDDDDTFSFKGKIVSYNTDEDSLSSFFFHTRHGSIKEFKFDILKEVKVL